MRQVADHMYSLGSGSHNFYLLVEDGQATIVDAGCSREWKKVIGGLASLGLSLESVAGVVATHAHADHFGFAKKAQEEGVSVAVHAEEESRALGTYRGRFSAGAPDLPMFRYWTLKNMFPMLVAGVMSLDHVDEVNTFDDGEELDLPGRPIAVHTPGHTEGHTMFHCPEQGALFTGDGLITMQLLGNTRGPQVMEDVFNLDPQQAMTSLDRITSLEAGLILPGHGEPWPGSPATAVELARA